jgi:hypothetical protein
MSVIEDCWLWGETEKAELSPATVQAAEHFGLDAARLRCLGGNSGSSWEAGEQVLRVGRPAVVDAELAAAGHAGCPCPARRRSRAGRTPGCTSGPHWPHPRTWTILTLDPAACTRRAQPEWRAPVEGWAEAGGLRDLPAALRAWACRFMLRDLARRYSPGDLKHVSRALRQADAAAAKTAS